ncbi:MAG: hypothetical protein ACI8Q1_003415 [Parvicella sp.]|jgi:hypothetical protein
MELQGLDSDGFGEGCLHNSTPNSFDFTFTNSIIKKRLAWVSRVQKAWVRIFKSAKRSG